MNDITVGGITYKITVNDSGGYLKTMVATPVLPWGWYLTADVGIWDSVAGQHKGDRSGWGYDVCVCEDAMIWCDYGLFYHVGYGHVILEDSVVYGSTVEAIVNFLEAFGVHRWNPSDM